MLNYSFGEKIDIFSGQSGMFSKDKRYYYTCVSIRPHSSTSSHKTECITPNALLGLEMVPGTLSEKGDKAIIEEETAQVRVVERVW
jgi:hypothetical protein